MLELTEKLRSLKGIIQSVEKQFGKGALMQLGDYPAALADADAAIKANPYVRRFGNALTNAKGQLEGLTKNGLLAQKAGSELSLTHFIEMDRARKAKYGKVTAEIDALYKNAAKFREADAELRSEIIALPKLVSAAVSIVRMAEERPKADKDRDSMDTLDAPVGNSAAMMRRCGLKRSGRWA